MQESKKAKVVKQKKVGNRITFSLFFLLLIFCLGLLVASAMPMVKIPVFSGLVANLALPDYLEKEITFGDYMAYSLGIPSNKIATIRDNMLYGSTGGLSPNSIPSQNRLLNARAAYAEEYKKTGIRPSIIDGVYKDNRPLTDKEIGEYTSGQRGLTSEGEKALTEGYFVNDNISSNSDNKNAKTSDTNNLDTNLLGQGNITRPTLATSKGLMSVQQQAPISLSNSTMVKPTTRSQLTMLEKEDIRTKYMSNMAKSFRFGRLGAIGGIDATFAIVGNKLDNGGGQFNAFGASGADLAHAFYYSRYSLGQKYREGMKHLAEIAFQGGELEEDVVLTKDDKELVSPELSNTSTPNTILARATRSKNACEQGQRQNAEPLKQAEKRMQDAFNEIYKISSDTSNVADAGAPGNCQQSSVFTFIRKRTQELRDEWNKQVDALITACEEAEQINKKIASSCNMEYKNECENGGECCKSYNALKLAGGAGAFHWACRTNISWENVGASNYWASVNGCGMGSNAYQEQCELNDDFARDENGKIYTKIIVEDGKEKEIKLTWKEKFPDDNPKLKKVAWEKECYENLLDGSKQVSKSGGREDCMQKLETLRQKVNQAEMGLTDDFMDFLPDYEEDKDTSNNANNDNSYWNNPYSPVSEMEESSTDLVVIGEEKKGKIEKIIKSEEE